MMRNCILLFFIFSFLHAVNPVWADQAAFVGGRSVVVDAGHGGCDPGAVYKDIYEKNINLQTAMKVKKLLEGVGISVVLTRDGDYQLVEESQRRDLCRRVEIINNSNADLLVSIHVNSHNKVSHNGAEVFYYPKLEKSKLLAESVLDQLCTIKNNPPKRAVKICNYYVLRNTSIPAAMVEIGYLSNTEDRRCLLDDKYQDLLARRISCGILKYLMMK